MSDPSPSQTRAKVRSWEAWYVKTISPSAKTVLSLGIVCMLFAASIHDMRQEYHQIIDETVKPIMKKVSKIRQDLGGIKCDLKWYEYSKLKGNCNEICTLAHEASGARYSAKQHSRRLINFPAWMLTQVFVLFRGGDISPDEFMKRRNCDRILESVAKTNETVDELCFTVAKNLTLGFFVTFFILCFANTFQKHHQKPDPAFDVKPKRDTKELKSM